MTKRIKAYDIAKGIGIILVILGHMQYIEGISRYFIVSFHMPLFFVISGMLMRRTGAERIQTNEFFKKKLHQIMMPYLLLSIIFIILDAVTNGTAGTVFNIYSSICLYGVSVLWFLPAAFTGMLLFQILRRKTGHILTAVIVIILTILAFLLSVELNLLLMAYALYPVTFYLYRLSVAVLVSFFAIFYIFIGYYLEMLFSDTILKNYLYYDSDSPKNNNTIFLLVKLFSGCGLLYTVFLVSQHNSVTDLHLLNFNYTHLFLFTSIAGSVGIILVSLALEHMSDFFIVKLLIFYGKNSLTVMVTHMDFYFMYISIIITGYIFNYIPWQEHSEWCPVMLFIILILEIPAIFIKNIIKKRL